MHNFSDDELAEIKANPITGALKACNEVFYHVNNDPEWDDDQYDHVLVTHALLEQLIEAGLLDVEVAFFGSTDSTSDMLNFIREVAQACEALQKRTRAQEVRARLKTALGDTFTYEFSQGDLDRVQVVINELRSLITKQPELTAEHRARLLKKLETLQSELHKKVSDLDRLWGLIGEAGVVVGKLGTDAKPIVDRIRELVSIAWQTQSRREELPSGTKPPQLEGVTPE